MVGPSFSLPANWTQFLKYLADEHDIDLNVVVSELCEWAYSIMKIKNRLRFRWMKLFAEGNS